VGPEEELGPLLEAFSEHCSERDWSFAFFQARPERLPLYRSLGWRALHIGEDPIIWTEPFTLEGSTMGLQAGGKVQQRSFASTEAVRASGRSLLVCHQ